jgi:hypothetical protein
LHPSAGQVETAAAIGSGACHCSLVRPHNASRGRALGHCRPAARRVRGGLALAGTEDCQHRIQARHTGWPLVRSPYQLLGGYYLHKAADATLIPIAKGTARLDHEKQAATYRAVHELTDDWGLFDDPNLLVKTAFDNYSPTLRAAGELSGYLPGGQLSWQLPGVPRHLGGHGRRRTVGCGPWLWLGELMCCHVLGTERSSRRR